MMAIASIPVDLFNPGQVFACLGYIEVAHVILGDASGGFEWRGAEASRFVLNVPGVANGFGTVFDFLRDSGHRAQWLSADESMVERDGGRTLVLPGIAQSGDPQPHYLPAQFIGSVGRESRKVPFGYWADGSSRRFPVFKKSTNGASVHVRFENARRAVSEIDRDAAVADPLNIASRTASLFRLDPRGSVNPLNAGSSPDKLRKGGINIRVATYPMCELVALFGLQHARPAVSRFDDYVGFTYSAWTCPDSCADMELGLLPVELARAALGGELPFIVSRRFLVTHVEVKKGGDREILETREVTQA
jgi:CRISPR-associated protein Csx14